MNYFMIYCTEDGEPRVYAMDREKVLKYIQHKGQDPVDQG